MKKNIQILALAVLCLLTAGCGQQTKKNSGQSVAESREAKALLQGIWTDEESGEVVFRVEGDSVYYPDSTSQPAYFRIVSDSFLLGSETRYPIEKQSAHVFWFRNQVGDLLKLVKSDNPEDADDFVHDDTPRVITYTEVVKRDSVVMVDGERYHWYVAINPTKYKVTAKSYNSDGLEVENVYYDNIMHVSLFRGGAQVFSSDFRKQMYDGMVPARFLEGAIFSDMEFTGADAKGFHFVATFCLPEGATCYKVDNVVSRKGQLSKVLVEY